MRKANSTFKTNLRLIKILFVLAIATGLFLIWTLVWINISDCLDSHGWWFAGSGTPGVIDIGGGVQLERAIAFRENYHVYSIDGETVIYGDGRRFGKVGTDGVIVVPFGELAGQSDRPSEKSRGCSEIMLRADDVLTAAYPDGSVSAVFDGWQLDSPRIYGEYIAFRIYYCDCVYKIVHI